MERVHIYDLPRRFDCASMGDGKELTVKQLKQSLRERGLPVSGLKAELIARLTTSTMGTSELMPQQRSAAASSLPIVEIEHCKQ